MQILAEMNRLTSVDVKSRFYGNLDTMTPKLSMLYQAKGGKSASFFKTEIANLNASVAVITNIKFC